MTHDVDLEVTAGIAAWERRAAGWLVQRMWTRHRRGKSYATPAGARAVTLPGNSGGTVAAWFWPHEAPRGLVVLAHPDKRHAKQWFVNEGHVAFLQAHGFEVLAIDFVAYGDSHGPATYYYEDLVLAARWARREAGGLPVHVWGVSLGAFTAANASPYLDFVDGLVLESPYPSFADWYGEGRGAQAMRLFGAMFPTTARHIHAGERIRHAAAKRILVAWSDADTVTRPALSKAVADAAPVGRTTAHVVTGVEHLDLHPDAGYLEAVLATFAGQASAAPAATQGAAAQLSPLATRRA